jgi:flagellar hook-associated protein 3 FlgL
MRIGFNQQYDAFRANLNRTQSRYFDAQRSLTTGRRINAPGDDPLGTAVSLSMRSFRAAAEQFGKNLHQAKAQLGFAESALDEVGKTMKRSYELALAGANGATTQEGREGMIREVEQAQKRLLDLANSRGHSGQYIFAGQRSDARPFTVENGALAYHGDDLDVLVEIGPGETMAVNLRARTPFQEAYAQLEDLKTSLQGGNVSRLSDVVIPGIQGAQKRFTEERGSLGARLRLVEENQQHHARRIDELTKGLSEIEDVDMADAILQFKMAETAYHAALQTVTQASRMSLMDFMR